MYGDKVMEHFKNPHNFGEMKDADAIGKVGNPKCLLPGTVVQSKDNYVEIGSLKSGDTVLGHEGFYNKVEKKFSRDYSGELIRVKNKMGITFLTPEHEVLGVKVPKRWKYNYSKNRRKLFSEWLHAYELEKGDLALLPILREIKDKKFIEFRQEKKKRDYRSLNIPKKIKISKEFLKLAGYYVAEGHLNEKVTKTYVLFAFHIDEKNLVEDVVKSTKKVFGLEAKIKEIPERKTTRVTINNVWVTKLFKSLFNKGAAKKKIPQWMMLLPPKKQKSFICALWKGDGYFNAKKPRAGYSTISYQLSQQLKTLLMRQEIVPSIYREEERTSKDGVRHKKAYRIHIGDRQSLEKLAKILNRDFKPVKSIATDSWFLDGKLFIPITEVEKIKYRGKVQNLKIENSKSFVTESLTVHNCGDLMWIYIKVGKNENGEEIIKDIKFKTFGCVAAIANSSVLTDVVKGWTLDKAEKITKEDLLKEMDEIPPIKIHCSILAADGLKDAIKNYREKKNKKK
ncbi:MAG: iron-sulfur cluster assembly scaffold protein [Candidatus Diapherotrites archaeon]